MPSLAPVLFLSHGSPTNAVEDNEFTRALAAFGSRLARPRAILCVSAHWVSEGPILGPTAASSLIYDFYGFPPPLYRVRWPAPASPEFVRDCVDLLEGFSPDIDARRGLDHGAWTVLKLLFPAADLPVAQISLATALSPQEHAKLARALSALREGGVLIVGSGNFTHNLGEVSWAAGVPPPAWALDFDAEAAKAVALGDIGFVERAVEDSRGGRLRAHPTDEHLLPLLYAMAAARSEERAATIYEGWQNSSLSMRCIGWGL